MHLSTVSDWLTWLYQDHSQHIELGLARVQKAAAHLGLLNPTCPVIIVGGTNGKGSTVKAIESIACAAQYQVGCFTSPFLHKANEQIRINGDMVSDDTLCQAFQELADTQCELDLTPFERFTLVALLIFKKYKLDLMVLEVGLGGRLDAVNIMSPTITVVTSIGIDHVAFLGDTREKIGYEKAGIFRPHVPAVCGDVDPPRSVVAQASALQAPFFCQGVAFHYVEKEKTWDFCCDTARYDDLPLTSLALQNMSTALMAITCLQKYLPVSHAAVVKGLTDIHLPGRIQIIHEPVMKIFDVAHNAHAIQLLKKKLTSLPMSGKRYAVFSMFADKDILESILCMKDMLTHWHVAPLTSQRAASDEQLRAVFKEAKIQDVSFFADIVDAYHDACTKAQPGDVIIIFGSFHTVAAIQEGVIPKR